MRGIADMQQDLMTELRATSAVTSLLPDEKAITQGYPPDDLPYDVIVALIPIYEGSTRHRDATTKRYRIQASVYATTGWREAQEPGSDGLLEMNRILAAVGDVLDSAEGVREYPEGGRSSPGAEPVDDGWLMVTADWVVAGTYLE